MLKSLDLAITILSSNEPNSTIFEPNIKETDFLEIIGQKNIPYRVNNLILENDKLYYVIEKNIAISQASKPLSVGFTKRSLVELPSQIIDIKVLNNKCIFVLQNPDKQYSLYFIASRKESAGLSVNINKPWHSDIINWFALTKQSQIDIVNYLSVGQKITLLIKDKVKKVILLDQRYGLATLESGQNGKMPLIIFDRRGDLVNTFYLPIGAKLLSANENYNIFAIEETENTSEPVGLIICLNPLSIKRINLEIKPDFIICRPWGYILANEQGCILVLNQEGEIIKKYELNLGKITAITALSKNRILVASWQNNQTILSYGRIRLR